MQIVIETGSVRVSNAPHLVHNWIVHGIDSQSSSGFERGRFRTVPWNQLGEILTFVVAFVGEGPEALAAERGLLTTILRDPIANGTVAVQRVADGASLERLCADRAQSSRCRCVSVTTDERAMNVEGVDMVTMQVTAAAPQLQGLDGEPEEADGALCSWGSALKRVLEEWV